MSIIERSPATVDHLDLPAPGLWNIPTGWAMIELSVPQMLRQSMQAYVRMKQGMIAVADDPTHSTVNCSLDACSLATGNPALDLYLRERVLDIAKYSTIPVRIATVEHIDGPHWNAHGWVTIRGVSIPIELAVTYEGVLGPRSIAHFRAEGTLALRSILPVNHGLRGRFLAGRHLRISIEIYAESLRLTR